MIKFDDAIRIVKANTLTPVTEIIPLQNSAGRILGSDINADRDMPPFNKSAVDGYACRRDDLGGELRILETIAAGYSPQKEVTYGTCSKIMTGAMVPSDADYILMVEDAVEEDGFIMATSDIYKTRSNNNICYQGEDIKSGTTLLRAGQMINSAVIAILASAGVVNVQVNKTPKIGIMSTGDEIVEPDVTPGVAQIRDSNGWQLRVQTDLLKCDIRYYGIIRDNIEELKATIERSSDECDIIIISGGVSAGDYDFVPKAIKDCGYSILFDKIAVQPGKPSTFAVKRSGDKVISAIFALPGNPVSSYVQFCMIVKPYIIKCMGGDYSPFNIPLVCSSTYTRKNSDRLSLIPVTIGEDGTFTPVKYNGSAHITALAEASAVAAIPEGISRVLPGESLRVYLLG